MKIVTTHPQTLNLNCHGQNPGQELAHSLHRISFEKRIVSQKKKRHRESQINIGMTANLIRIVTDQGEEMVASEILLGLFVYSRDSSFLRYS